MFDLEAEYEVITFSIGDTKSGTKMGKLQLKKIDDESVLNCILWEETLNRLENKIFRCGNIVKISSGSYNEKFNNCLVSNLELVKQAQLGLPEAQTEQAFKDILSYVESIEKADLKKFVKNLLNEHKDKFKIAPAAKMMHHNYLGGLLQHTLECAQIADNLVSHLYKEIDRDSVIAASILHDFGKIFEYKIDVDSGLIDYDEDFKKEWISHSQWAFSTCMIQGHKLVAKMIAAHHGRAEWGAIVDLNDKNLEPITYLIHHIDDLSAKFGKTSVNDLC